MGYPEGDWRLTPAERMEAKTAGVCAYFAGKFNVIEDDVDVISARNKYADTLSGPIGHMIIRVDFAREGREHIRFLYFGDNAPTGMEDMSEAHKTLLGGFAIKYDQRNGGREYLNCTIDQYGLPLAGRVSLPSPIEIAPALELVPELIATPNAHVDTSASQAA